MIERQRGGSGTDCGTGPGSSVVAHTELQKLQNSGRFPYGVVKTNSTQPYCECPRGARNGRRRKR
jgi:hypothetical protein